MPVFAGPHLPLLCSLPRSNELMWGQATWLLTLCGISLQLHCLLLFRAAEIQNCFPSSQHCSLLPAAQHQRGGPGQIPPDSAQPLRREQGWEDSEIGTGLVSWA